MQRRAATVSITSARAARSADISSRQTRYVLSMAIRTLCFVGAVAAEGWLRWTLVAGALVLPYVAVVMANAGVRKDPPPPETFTSARGEFGGSPPAGGG